MRKQDVPKWAGPFQSTEAALPEGLYPVRVTDVSQHGNSLTLRRMKKPAAGDDGRRGGK